MATIKFKTEEQLRDKTANLKKQGPFPAHMQYGYSNDLPSFLPQEYMLYTSDTGEVYIGTGINRPLKKLTNIITADDPDEFPIVGRRDTFYISESSKAIYYWNGESYINLTAKNTDQNSGIIEVESYDELPDKGTDKCLYIDKNTNSIYRYDLKLASYILLTEDSNVIADLINRLDSMELNKVDVTLLSQYRNKKDLLTINDLDKNLANKINESHEVYDDTAVKEALTTLQNSKADVKQLANYRSISSKIATEDLSSDIVNQLSSIADKVDSDDTYLKDEVDNLINNVKDNIEPYIHPDTHPANIIVQNTDLQFVSQLEKDEWNAKQEALAFTPANIEAVYSKEEVNELISNISSDTVITNPPYVHPDTHPANIIVQSAELQFVSQTEKDDWNAKQEALKFTPANAESVYNKEEIDSIIKDVSSNIEPYVHPDTHSVDMIVETNEKQFVSINEKTIWNAKQEALNFVPADAESVYIKEEVNELINNVSNSIEPYVHPSTHPANIIVQDNELQFVSQTEKNKWNAKQEALEFTPANIESVYNKNEIDDLLNDIKDNTSSYVHPDSHPADIIIETDEKQFVSNNEKAAWDAKQEALNFIPANAESVYSKEEVDELINNVNSGTTITNPPYVHPDTHPADMIVETEEKQFVSADEKAIWNSNTPQIERTVKLADGLSCTKETLLGYKKGGFVIASNKDYSTLKNIVLSLEDSQNGTVKVLAMGQYTINNYEDGSSCFVGEQGEIKDTPTTTSGSFVKMIGSMERNVLMFNPDTISIQLA